MKKQREIFSKVATLLILRVIFCNTLVIPKNCDFQFRIVDIESLVTCQSQTQSIAVPPFVARYDDQEDKKKEKGSSK